MNRSHADSLPAIREGTSVHARPGMELVNDNETPLIRI